LNGAIYLAIEPVRSQAGRAGCREGIVDRINRERSQG
jgi:hypothetical protein